MHISYIINPKMCFNQSYLTTDSDVFYKVANSYKFVQPHTYDFIRFV